MSHALANALPIVCALRAPVTDLSLPPPPQDSFRSSHCCASAFSPAQHVSSSAADAAAAPARPLSGAQATSYRKSRSAPSLIPPLQTAAPGPFHPYPFEGRCKEPKVTAPTSVLFSCKVKERSRRVLTEGEIKAPAVPSPRVSFTSSRKANFSGAWGTRRSLTLSSREGQREDQVLHLPEQGRVKCD